MSRGVSATAGDGLDEFIALEMQTLQTDDNPRATAPQSNVPNKLHLLRQRHPSDSTSSPPSRVLPCESCGEGSRRPAVVYCEHCCGHFCMDCDARFHPAQNIVMSRHTRIRIPEDLARYRPPGTNAMRCKLHPEDPVTYFCFDCLTLSCSECVVHGPHRNHSVQDKRKSFSIIKEKTEEILTQFHAQSEDMSSLQRKIDVLKQEIIDNTRAVKQTMAMSFNEIRDRLNKKEEELMTNADLFMTEQVGQLDMYVTSTRDKVQMLEAVSGMISEQLSGQDEVGLINFYTENHSQFYELSSTIASLSHDLPEIAARKSYLDVEAANSQISMLQGLHLIIAGLHNDPSPQTLQQAQHPPAANDPPKPRAKSSASAKPPTRQTSFTQPTSPAGRRPPHNMRASASPANNKTRR